jgi:hypothetical protein
VDLDLLSLKVNLFICSQRRRKASNGRNPPKSCKVRYGMTLCGCSQFCAALKSFLTCSTDKILTSPFLTLTFMFSVGLHAIH